MSGAMRAGSHTSDSSSALPMCSLSSAMSAGSVMVLPRNTKSPVSGMTNTAGHSLALDSGSPPMKSGTAVLLEMPGFHPRASLAPGRLVKRGKNVPDQSACLPAAHRDRVQLLPCSDVRGDLVRMGERQKTRQHLDGHQVRVGDIERFPRSATLPVGAHRNDAQGH